jgi:hypothetical protein
LKPPKFGEYVHSDGGVVIWPKAFNMAPDLKKLKPGDLKILCYLINRSSFNFADPHVMRVERLFAYLGSKATRASVEDSLTRLRDKTYPEWLLDSASAIDEKGFINWRFSEAGAELSNPERYGKLSLDVLRPLTSFAAIRIYQVMIERKDSEHKYEWMPTVDELKEKLGRQPAERFNNFKSRILTPAVKELNDVKAFGLNRLEMEPVRAKSGRGLKHAFVKFSLGAPPEPPRLETVEMPVVPVVEVVPYAPDIFDQILAGMEEPGAPMRDAEFELAAARYFGLIEAEAKRRANQLASENEPDDQLREFFGRIIRNLQITLEAEKHASLTDHRWRPPADLSNISQFTGELMTPDRGIAYGHPAPVRNAVPTPAEYRVAYIKQRNYGLRRRIRRPDPEDYQPNLPPPLFHAIKPGEKRSVCGIFLRLDGIQVAAAYNRRPPLRLLPEGMVTLRDQIERRIPKHWVTADAGTEVSCPRCKTLLRREKPSTRPKLRRRPGYKLREK